MTVETVVVPSSEVSERADKVIAAGLDLSRRQVRDILEVGGVTVDGHPVRASDRLEAGTMVSVVMPEAAKGPSGDSNVPFTVVYEDADLAVVDKPIGVVVHPTSERSIGTLVHGLLDRFPEIEGVGQANRWGIVHRLDRDTSGLLVVALNEPTYRSLSSMMKSRSVRRRYLTVVAGEFDAVTGAIDAPIGRDPSNPTRMRIDRGGRTARTHYRRLASWTRHDASLLSVTLETGRTHQIRVHFRAIDHPIIGDRAYGKAGTVGDPGRPWLHARQIAFAHPSTGAPIDAVARLPADLADSLTTLGSPDVGERIDIDGSDL